MYSFIRSHIATSRSFAMDSVFTSPPPRVDFRLQHPPATTRLFCNTLHPPASHSTTRIAGISTTARERRSVIMSAPARGPEATPLLSVVETSERARGVPARERGVEEKVPRRRRRRRARRSRRGGSRSTAAKDSRRRGLDWARRARSGGRTRGREGFATAPWPQPGWRRSPIRAPRKFP